MKPHIGVDAESGLVHAVHTTLANIADVSEGYRLLHGEETDVFADAGYAGAPKRDELKPCQTTWHMAARPSSIKRIKGDLLPTLVRQLERVKAQIRARVKHLHYTLLPQTSIKSAFP